MIAGNMGHIKVVTFVLRVKRRPRKVVSRQVTQLILYFGYRLHSI